MPHRFRALPALPATRLASLGLFVGLCLVLVGLAVAGSMFFSGEHLGGQLGRAGLTAAGVLGLGLGSQWLLRKEGYAPDALGLRPTWPHAAGGALGVAGGALFLAGLALALAVQVPFHWVPGGLPLSGVASASLGYFGNNFGEELIFRGYALLVLAQQLGVRRAVLVLALPFGLFHVPFAEPGLAALKMVATTSVMAVVFSYSFLLTGTLWTAVGLHVTLNVLLHTVLGLDGAARATCWKPVFEGPWPAAYDAPFWTLLGVAGLAAALLAGRRAQQPTTAKYAHGNEPIEPAGGHRN